jgi:hypothetical protein
MIEDIQARLDDYQKWLRDKTTLRQVQDEWVEVTTPFLDRHNDYLQIYARKQNGRYLLTDDGYTIDDLELSGCTLDTPKREMLLKMTLAGFGVKQQDNRLEVQATAGEFAQRKHDLIQAMLAINDMFYLARPFVESLFYEDVMFWLDVNEVRYTPRVKLPGQSGFDHLFDFVIPKSRDYPERFVQTINRPTRETVEKMTFAWFDVREARDPHARAFAILNDQDQNVPVKVTDALLSYGVEPLFFSRRAQALPQLAG